MRKVSKTPLIYALEPRLLFDGDLGADIASSIVYRDGNGDTTAAVAPENQRESLRAQPTAKRHSVVIIDGNLPDTQTLIDAAPQDAEIHVIDGSKDGFDQIAALLKNHDGIDELHIFGHGLAGEARLGTASLSTHTLTLHTDTLAVLKNALSLEGDILLYGCDIAAGDDGAAFIKELAEITAADIAASDDITGASGDWDLEFRSGTIESDIFRAEHYSADMGLSDVGANNIPQISGISKINALTTGVIAENLSSPNVSNANSDGSTTPIGRAGSDAGTYYADNKFYVLLEQKELNLTSANTVIGDKSIASTMIGNELRQDDDAELRNADNPTIGTANTQVNSYLVFLNYNNKNLNGGNERRSNRVAQIAFEGEILGIFFASGKTWDDGLFYNPDADYHIETGRDYRDAHDAANLSRNFENTKFVVDRHYDNNSLDDYDGANISNYTGVNLSSNSYDFITVGDYQSTGDNRFMQLGASNANAGDYIRVITSASPPPNSEPTVENATDVTGAVTELTDGDADENKATLTDTGSFTIADTDGDTVSVSRAFSSTTRGNNSAFGNLTATIADNTTSDGTGQINWTYSVDDSELDALDAGESYIETWTITVSDNTDSVTQNVTVTINGAADNEAPAVSTAAVDPSINEAADASSQNLNGGGSIAFTDDTDASLTIAGQGNSTVTASSGVTSSSSWTTALQNALAAAITVNDKGDNTADWSLNASGLNLDFLAVGDSITVENVVTATDDDGAAITDTITVTINGANDAPVVTAITDTKTEDDAAFTSDLTSGQTDPDGDSLSVSGTPTITAVDGSNNSVTLPDGAASVSGNNLSVDPTLFNDLDDGESVVITVTYDVSDGTTTTQNTATITINGANDAPVVTAITDTKTEDDEAFTSDLTSGQTDPDGDSLSVSGTPTITAVDGSNNSVTLPDGAASVSGNNLSVDPTLFNDLDDGESVVITVTYDVSDGTTTTQNTATITINGANDAPSAANDSGSVVVGTAFSGNVLNNNMGGEDTDVDTGDTLFVSALGSSAIAASSGATATATGTYGTLTLGREGSVSYEADQAASSALNFGDAAVTDSFTYTVSDGTDTDTATVTFSITAPDPGNSAPTVDAITDTKTENDAQYTLDLLTDANAADADSGDTVSMSGDVTLSFQNKDGNSASLPNGAASVSGSTLTIDPTVFNDLDDGESVVITVTYDVSDGTTTTQNTATITINGANDAPVVTAITDTKTEDDAAFTSDLTSGQTDPDGDSLSVSGTPTITAVDGSNNSVTLPDGAASVSGNNLSVDPTLFNDLDDGESVVITVTYDVSDGTTTTQNTATITINGANDAPVVTAITDTKTEDDEAFTSDLTPGQTDPDGDSLSVSGTPTITAVDGSNNSVTLPDGAASVSGNNLSVDPTLFNDLDDGESVVITVTYDVSDGTTTTQNTATITINGANDAPVVSALTDSKTKNDADYSFNLLQGASDVDGDTLSVSGTPSYAYVDKDGNSASLPNGAVQHNGNSLTVSPGVFSDLNAGENVTITVTYDVSDGTATVQNTATLTISGQNTQPEIVDDRGTPGPGDDRTGLASVITNEDTAFGFAADDFNYSDADSDALDHITIVSLPESGRLLLNNQPVTAGQDITAGDIGNLSFVPDANENGQEYASFVYSVNDGLTDSANGTMTVQVDAVNDAPTSADGNLALQGDDEVSLARTDFTFADIDGDALDHITIVSPPPNGDLTFRGQPVQAGDEIPANRIEQLSYNPDDGASGANYDSFQFSVNDGAVDSAVNYTMNIGVDAAPQAQDDSIRFDEDVLGGYRGTLQATDSEGGSLTYQITQQPQNGRVQLINDGPNYVFIPTAHYYGADEFEFVASDGTQNSTPAKISVTVDPVNDRPVARFGLGRQGVMEGGKVNIGPLSQLFGDVDAFDPSKNRFVSAIENLLTRGEFPNNAKLNPVPAEGRLTIDVVSPLPEGLFFDGTRIRGTAETPGVYEIVVRATDGPGLRRETSFELFVARPVVEEIVQPKEPETETTEPQKLEGDVEGINDHDLPPMLKVKPKRDGTPVGVDMPIIERRIDAKDDFGSVDDGSRLGDDSWLNTKVSSEQDVSGNIRVVDLEVQDNNIAVKITDEAVDNAERFEGELADGSQLPDWIKVDPDTGLTTATPPSGSEAVALRVIAKDEAGNERAIDLVLDPKALTESESAPEKTRQELRQERREAREERREARQAERQARVEAREERRAERAEARALKEFLRNETRVSVLADGRVQFVEGLVAENEGAIKLMRLVSEETSVKIEISDDLKAAATRYEVTMKDGSEAPEWVQVNAATGELTIDAPQEADIIELSIVASDSAGTERRIDLELDLEELQAVEEEGVEPIEDELPIEGEDEPAQTGSFMPLDAQIEAALSAEQQYGRTLQQVLQSRA